MKKSSLCRILSLGTALFLSAMTVFPAFAAARGIGPGFEEEIEDTSGRPSSPLDMKNKNKEETAAETEVSDTVDTPVSVASQKEEAPAEAVIAGESYGTFRISGYCGCELCCGGQTLTYSGVLPTADHTISADLNRFPLGTRLLIDGTVYTVEDMGGGVTGDRLDIYFNTHQEALDYGLKDVEVFAVLEKN